MAFLNNFFMSQFALPQGISPQPYRLDRLTSLPLELLTLIYDHLPSPVDRVCLCLCNHRLYILFMTYYQFPSLRRDNLSIFARLEKDLPGFFACDICNILHRYDGSESFGLSGMAHTKYSQLPCVRHGYEEDAECIGGSSVSMRTHSTFDHSKNRLSFLQVKLAMRRYLYGPRFGINTDSLAFTQIMEYRHPWLISKNSCTTLSVYQPVKLLFSIEAQVCPEPLGIHIRMQDIISYDIWQDSKIQVAWKPYVMNLFEICPHVSLQSKAAEIDAVYEGTNPSFPYTCPRCNTDSLVEFRKVGSKPALVMTRWVNLGPGIHRDDPLWKIHVFTCKDGTMPTKIPKEKELGFHSPRTSFENMAMLSFRDLKSRNLSYLRGDRYKSWFGPFAFDGKVSVWHISYRRLSTKTKELCQRVFQGIFPAFSTLFFYIGVFLIVIGTLHFFGLVSVF